MQVVKSSRTFAVIKQFVLFTSPNDGKNASHFFPSFCDLDMIAIKFSFCCMFRTYSMKVFHLIKFRAETTLSFPKLCSSLFLVDIAIFLSFWLFFDFFSPFVCLFVVIHCSGTGIVRNYDVTNIVFFITSQQT